MFRYKGIVLDKLPNGYSNEDVIQTLKHGSNSFYTAFQTKSYYETLSEFGLINRFEIFNHLDKQVYQIQFNLELINNKTVNENFSFTIPDDILNSNTVIAVDTLWNDLLPIKDSEQLNDRIYYNIIYNTIKKYNLTEDKIIVIGPYHNIKNVYKAKYVCAEYFFYYNNHQCNLNNRLKDIENRVIKEHKILCLNRKPRNHRLKLFNFAFENKLLDHNHHTFSCTIDEIKKYTNKEYSFVDLLPYKSNLDITKTIQQHLTTKNAMPFNTSYVDFITETRFEHNGPVILTEKISQPIYNLQPFVCCSTPGTLKVLKEKGFKTFSNWWSEDYDNIIDNEKRFDAICNLYEEMSLLDDNQWVNLIFDMKDVLLHNFNLVNEQLSQGNFYSNINSYFENNQIDK